MKKQNNFSKNKLFSSSEQFSVYLLAQINTQKMNFSVKNLFSKCEHIRIKLRIYSHLLNKSLTENFIFCVVNIIDFTTESSKFFFKLNCQSFLYFTSINTIINMLLEYKTFFKLPLIEEVPRNLQGNCLPKQFLNTIKRGILLQRETFCW